MRRFTALLALSGIIFIASLAPVRAQQNAPSAKLSSRTNVVLVPVIVTDKHGNHIRGLTRDDFEIKEGGAAQKIASFEEIIADSKPVPRQATLPNTFTNQIEVQQPKNLQIIALDLVNTSFLSQSAARRGLIEFLSKSADSGTLMALVALRTNGVHLIHNFTSDPSILIAAIKRVQSRFSSRDTSGIAVSGDEDAEALQIEAILEGGSANASSISGAGVMLKASAARVDASRESQEGLITLECLQQVAQYFAVVPGRKSLIWASTGFKFGHGAMTGEATRGTTLEDWQRTVRMLQDADIAVYPVDVGGLDLSVPMMVSNGRAVTTMDKVITGSSVALDAGSAGRLADPIQAKHETMRTVSTMTGGEAFYNNNDLEDLFRRASQDSAEYYMLSYSTPDAGKAGWRKLEVKIHRDGVQVRSRTGFFFTREEQNPDAVRQIDEELALTSALNFSALPISGSWLQTELAGDNRRVHFSLTIPAGAVTIDTYHENHLNFDFLAVATNATGQEAARISQRLERNLPPAAVAQIQATGITYANVLALAPGQYSIHIAARDNLSGKLGSVVSPLKVE